MNSIKVFLATVAFVISLPSLVKLILPSLDPSKTNDSKDFIEIVAGPKSLPKPPPCIDK